MKQAIRIVKPKAIQWRLYVVLITILILFICVLIKTIFIQFLDADKLQNESDMRSLRTVNHIEQRGIIYDRNGEVLAVSVPVYGLVIDPEVILKQDKFQDMRLWEALADVINEPVADIINKIKNNPKKRFIYLKRHLSKPVGDYIKKLKIKGVSLKNESKRSYPAGEIMAQLIGITNIDDKGIEGLEKNYNDWLTGTPTKQSVRKARNGSVVEHLDYVVQGVKSNDLVLSIDYRIQQLAYRELKKSFIVNQATSASIVVIDVNNGEILAMATVPSYNPNVKDDLQAYKMRNRAITDSYEPGSTVKPFVVAAGLENGVIKNNELIDTKNGWLNLGGKIVKDTRDYGESSVARILEKSSNVGITEISLKMEASTILKAYKDAGLGELSGSNLIGESAGVLPIEGRRKKSRFEQATLSFGYGLTATSLQLARMYSTLGNGGLLYPSSIFKLSEVPDATRAMSKEVASDLLNMLVGVLEKGGTAKQAYIDGYPVAGKTGTSRKAIAGGYGNDYMGLFVGVAPVNNPRLAISVIINDPKGDKVYGGDVAAPVFKEVMAGALQFLNVEPMSEKAQRELIQSARDKYGIN